VVDIQSKRRSEGEIKYLVSVYRTFKELWEYGGGIIWTHLEFVENHQKRLIELLVYW